MYLSARAHQINDALNRFKNLFYFKMFDQTTVGEVVLENCGRVGFNFVGISGLGEDPSIPGIPILEPMSGFVPAFSKVTLLVHYLPGVPEKFHKTFEVNRFSRF